MVVVFGLLAAFAFGAGDLAGGVATRTDDARRVTLISKSLSLVLMPAVAWAVTGAPVASALLPGIAVGIISPLALSSFYAAMARGPIGIVSPITSVFVAVVPIAVGLAVGERPGIVAWVGVAIALPAIVLMTRSGGEHQRIDPVALGLAVVAGAGFGGLFAVLGTAPDEAGLWPIAISNPVSVVFLLMLLRLAGTSARGPLSPLPVFAGLMDATGNAAFVLATRAGSLTLAGVLSALYPAATVALAAVLLGERPTRVQTIGLALGLVAVVLLALG